MHKYNIQHKTKLFLEICYKTSYSSIYLILKINNNTINSIF